jgi:hypothetical protein
MVQRDANLLPTQVVKDSVDWTSDRQVNGEGAPLDVSELDENDDAGSPQYPSVFSGLITTEATDPTEVLRRGLFLDLDGNFLVDPSNDGASIYGGKKVIRVAADLSGNATARPGVETFSEYRVEVSHTSTGVLPVTEQTDGIDIDRLLTTPPSTDDEATGGNQSGTTDATLLSPNSPMIEFVLGTAVGNNYAFKPEEYGLPLVAKVTTESGEQQTVIRAYDPESDTIQDQIAFLIRSRDPEDTTKESFLALTKGGAWLTSLQGQGSKVTQENLRTGKVSFYGMDADGHSRILNASGAVSIKSLTGRPTDNVGVEIKSDKGAVSIYGGGPNSEGAADGSQNPNSPSNSKMALKLESANGAQLQAAEQVKVAAPEINLTENKTTNVSASSAFNVNAGDTISLSSKTLGMTINGAAEYVFGGPLDGLATNGATRNTSFTGTPLTGALGGSVDDYKVTFGGRSELFRVGRDVQVINVGMVDLRTMGPATPAFTPGAGLSFMTGFPFIDNGFSASPLTGTTVASKIGATSVRSAGGPVSITGTTGTFITSIAKTQISAPYVNVIAPLSPFGGVLTDGCLDSLTGRPFLLSGSIGAPTFRVGP